MFSFAIYIPASVYYANQVMDENNKVRGQAMVTMAYTVGGVFGNLIGGRLIDRYDVHVMLVVGTVCAAVGTIFFFFGTRKIKA